MYPNNNKSQLTHPPSFSADPCLNFENMNNDKRSLPTDMKRESHIIDASIHHFELNKENMLHPQNQASLIPNKICDSFLPQSSDPNFMNSPHPINSIVQKLNEGTINVKNQAKINKEFDCKIEGSYSCDKTMQQHNGFHCESRDLLLNKEISYTKQRYITNLSHLIESFKIFSIHDNSSKTPNVHINNQNGSHTVNMPKLLYDESFKSNSSLQVDCENANCISSNLMKSIKNPIKVLKNNEEDKETLVTENRFDKVIRKLNELTLDTPRVISSLVSTKKINKKQEIANKNYESKMEAQFPNDNTQKKIIEYLPNQNINSLLTEELKEAEDVKLVTNDNRFPYMQTNRFEPITEYNRSLARKEEEDNFNEEEKEKVQDKERNNQKKYSCVFCGRCFTPQGLGGHMARAHPGMNREYERKQKISKANKPRMRILRLAQLIYKFERNLLNEVNVEILRSYIIKNKLLIEEKAKEIMDKENLTLLEAIEKLEIEQEQIMTAKDHEHS